MFKNVFLQAFKYFKILRTSDLDDNSINIYDYYCKFRLSNDYINFSQKNVLGHSKLHFKELLVEE